MTFKIDFDKFVKVKAIESFDDVPEGHSVYCCTKQAPEKIDKVSIIFNDLGDEFHIFQPLSYVGEVTINLKKDYIFVALPPKEAKQCDYFWTLQKLPKILEEMEK